MQDILDAIRAAHRERVYAMEQRKRADLALLSFLRTQAGWRLDLPEAERKAIAERAKAFADGEDDEGLAQWRSIVDASVGARAPFEAVEKAALKRMEEAAEQLPVWESFGKAIRGFGPASLAVIVGEAGDLSIYGNPAKLWKRMGVGIVDGIRQGGLSKNASKEDWIAHGYNRQRRSRLWNIGDALIKSNRDGKYRTAYLQRKDYEVARDPAMKPIHAHRRAQRFMEKMLLRDLWSAWRQTITTLKPVRGMSAASLSEQQSSIGVQPNYDLTAAATGHTAGDTQRVIAGRFSFNSELLDELDAALPKPRKRRTTSRLPPKQGASGASIRQTSSSLSPTNQVSAKRRATVLATSNQGMPGAPIQSATHPVQPTAVMPTDRSPTVLSSPTNRDTSGSTLSRASGTGDRQCRPEIHVHRAVVR